MEVNPINNQSSIQDLSMILNHDDVLHTGSSALMYQCTFKVSEFLAIMQSKLEEQQLFSEGLDCNILRPGQAWTQGKVRVCLEFTPDATSTPGGTMMVSQLPSTQVIPPSAKPEDLPPFLRRQRSRTGMWS